MSAAHDLPERLAIHKRCGSLILNIALFTLMAATLCYGSQLLALWVGLHPPIRDWYAIVGGVAFLAPSAGQALLTGTGVGLMTGVLFARHVIRASVGLSLVQFAFYLRWLLHLKLPMWLCIRTSVHVGTCSLFLIVGALISSRLCRLVRATRSA